MIFADDNSLDNFWRNYPEIKQFIDNMNAVEHWVLDDVDNAQLDFNQWAEQLDQSTLKEINKKGEQLLVILGLMSTSRAIFVLNQLKQHCRPLASTLTTIAIQKANNKKLSRFCTIYLDRVTVTETQEVFQSVFDTDRLTRVYKSLKEANKEVGDLHG